MKFKSGDVVQINGGLPMTVREYVNCEVVCNWFVGTELKQEAFKEEMLILLN